MMAYTNKVKELCVQGEHDTLDQVMDIYIYIHGLPKLLELPKKQHGDQTLKENTQ